MASFYHTSGRLSFGPDKKFFQSAQFTNQSGKSTYKMAPDETCDVTASEYKKLRDEYWKNNFSPEMFLRKMQASQATHVADILDNHYRKQMQIEPQIIFSETKEDPGSNLKRSNYSGSNYSGSNSRRNPFQKSINDIEATAYTI